MRVVCVSGETNRVRLNLRIDEDVKRNFNNEIKAKFGKCRPYAGIELEREFRYFLNQGELADLQDVVDDLTDTLGGSESKEKLVRLTEVRQSLLLTESLKTFVQP